jgi:hypothetical protein
MWWREGGDISKGALVDQVRYMLNGPCCTSHAFHGDVLRDSVRVPGLDGTHDPPQGHRPQLDSCQWRLYFDAFPGAQWNPTRSLLCIEAIVKDLGMGYVQVAEHRPSGGSLRPGARPPVATS